LCYPAALAADGLSACQRKTLTHAHRVTAVVFDGDFSGSLDCQIGASSLWQAVLFDWVKAKFG
jgi:hypothetical protein